MICSAAHVSRGLKILLRYEPEASIDVDDDRILFVGEKAEPLRDSDKDQLIELGWVFDEDEDGWSYSS